MTWGRWLLAQTLPEDAAAWLRSAGKRWDWVSRISAGDRAHIHFALGRSADGGGRRHEAWRHWAAGNALMSASDGEGAYDAARMPRMLRMLRSMFVPSAAAGSLWARLLEGRAGSTDRTSIFVVGVPRSGSTLLEAMLGAHADVWAAGEDTALAPLVPDLIAALQVDGAVDAARVAAVGDRYVAEMRRRIPDESRGARRIVDKMLANAW